MPKKKERKYNKFTLDRWLDTDSTKLFEHRLGESEEVESHQRDPSAKYLRLWRYRRRRRRRIEIPTETDEWDGSIDNAERILEDHVSKYGW